MTSNDGWSIEQPRLKAFAAPKRLAGLVSFFIEGFPYELYSPLHDNEQ